MSGFLDIFKSIFNLLFSIPVPTLGFSFGALVVAGVFVDVGLILIRKIYKSGGSKNGES